jgi:acetyl-CoA carboxylase biotin carboxyl carrier protein
MELHERDLSWVKRVEELIESLDGTTIGELELREAGTEIIIRRQPDMLLVAAPTQHMGAVQSSAFDGARPPAGREERSQPVAAPLTGVYYSAPAPTSPSFVNLGDMIAVGQVVALIEAMKVFNEIQSEVAGRVVAMPANSGDVVQKGQALLKVEPL